MPHVFYSPPFKKVSLKAPTRKQRSAPEPRSDSSAPGLAAHSIGQIDFSPRPLLAAPAAVGAASAPIQRCCDKEDCTNPSCTEPSHFNLDLESIMGGLDPMEEMQHSMKLSSSRQKKQSEKFQEMPSHLKGSMKVNRKNRRVATIKSPSDRLALSSEPKPQKELHYVALQQRPGHGKSPIFLGRLQDPRNKNAPVTERHIYEKGTRGAPSYPKEAANLNRIKKAKNLSDPQIFGEVEKAMNVDPLGLSEEKDQRHLMTTANIINIAETRRDPFMGFSSAQTIDYAQQEESGLTPDLVFGKRSGKKNLPGFLPASGTGATGQFRDFRAKLEEGQDQTGIHGKRLYKNIKRQHLSLMRQGYNPVTVKRLLEEGMSPKDIRRAMKARMRSSATRRAAYSTGQIPYRLRPLRRPSKLDPHAKANAKIKKIRNARLKALNKRRGVKEI